MKLPHKGVPVVVVVVVVDTTDWRVEITKLTLFKGFVIKLYDLLFAFITAKV